MRLIRTLTVWTAVLVASLPLSDSVRADSAATQPSDRKAIEKIVREYLLTHPEIIEEAIHALQIKREREQRARSSAAIAAHGKALRDHPMTPVSGNAKGDVTVVEFFDYECGYCKRSLASMISLMRNDPDVKIVWKELPILGPMSRYAARAAMAAKKQGKYLDFHIALMGTRGRLSETKVLGAAKDVGLDVDRLQRDMKDPQIDAYLDETLELAHALGIRGTPAFVIGDTLEGGALSEARMREIIAQSRAGG